VRNRSVGWDRRVAAYANQRHRRIVDAKSFYGSVIEADEIALAILGGTNN
jgi:hypothetical protein